MIYQKLQRTDYPARAAFCRKRVPHAASLGSHPQRENELPAGTTTGIHSPETAIKMMLAGANAVQVSSILYKKGILVKNGW